MKSLNRVMRPVVVFILSVVFFFVVAPSTLRGQGSNDIVTGDQQMPLLVEKLKGMRVGLLVNQTSVVGATHLADTLKSLKINLKKIFSPEHGFRGNAADGELVKDGVDKQTGVPIVSLYGSNKKPTAEQLSDVDIVVYDVQDVGARFYTYISSLHYLMEACAALNKKILVLDRPDPNDFVDGPVLQPELKSFVGMHPIPIAYGMTVGEFARMVNEEGWLEGSRKCELDVIAMKNYEHGKAWALPVKPSPNLPNNHAVALYPSICLFEGTVISLGRGTAMPFEILGNPDLKNMPFEFTPISIPGVSVDPPLKGILCHGLDLRSEKPVRRISLQHVIDFYHAYPEKEKFFKKYFDTLAGTKTLRLQIEQGMSESQIRQTWGPGLDAFKIVRARYIIYGQP